MKVNFIKKIDREDIINGSIPKNIILFAFPLALTGIFQQLFNACDTAVAGRFVNDNANAAVGSNGAIIGLIINLFTGIALGSNVIIARSIGSKDDEKIRKVISTSIVFALVSGFVMMIIGLLLSRRLLMLMDVPPEVFPMALSYLRIYLLGLPVILLYNFESSFFRANGDSRTPLLCLIISGVINVILNLVFVIVFKIGVAGVAIATIISNLISSVMLLIILLKSKGRLSFSLKKLSVDFNILLKMLKIGVPAGVQGSVFSFSNILIQASINALGATIMAASSTAFYVEIIVYFIISAFGQATTTFIGQNHGAGNLLRCKKIIKVGLLMAELITIISTVVAIFISPFVFRAFTDSYEVIKFASTRVLFIVGFEFLSTLIEVISGSFRGFGKSLSPAIICLVGICGTRIIWLKTYYSVHKSFQTLMVCYPLSWAITALILVPVFIITLKRIYKGINEASS